MDVNTNDRNLSVEVEERELKTFFTNILRDILEQRARHLWEEEKAEFYANNIPDELE